MGPYRHRLFLYLDFDGRTFSKNRIKERAPLPRLFQRSKIESLTSRSYLFFKTKAVSATCRVEGSDRAVAIPGRGRR
jgi:hypothetical protein